VNSEWLNELVANELIANESLKQIDTRRWNRQLRSPYVGPSWASDRNTSRAFDDGRPGSRDQAARSECD
jgi:hypothetical protein